MTVAVQDFDFIGGTLGHGRRRSGDQRHRICRAIHRHAALRPCLPPRAAARHARGHVLADADAAHDGRSCGACGPRSLPLYRRADQSDDRRRHRLLRHAGPISTSPSPARVIGFAGAARHRTDRCAKNCREGFQRAEYLQAHGMVDHASCRASEMRATLATALLGLLMKHARRRHGRAQDRAADFRRGE